MKLDKLFGSKAKVDILKYLLFKREGLSIRALESELDRTFPAIKKQVDSLQEGKIAEIDKEGNSRSIKIREVLKPVLKDLLIHALKSDLESLFEKYDSRIYRFFCGNIFGYQIEDIDLIILYQGLDADEISKLKIKVSNIFHNYFISRIGLVCMSLDERKKRYRLTDRFVLNIMRKLPETKEIVEGG